VLNKYEIIAENKKNGETSVRALIFDWADDDIQGGFRPPEGVQPQIANRIAAKVGGQDHHQMEQANGGGPGGGGGTKNSIKAGGSKSNLNVLKGKGKHQGGTNYSVDERPAKVEAVGFDELMNHTLVASAAGARPGILSGRGDPVEFGDLQDDDVDDEDQLARHRKLPGGNSVAGSSPAWNPGSWAGAPGANNRQQQQSKREVRGGKTLAEVNSSNSQDQANQEAQALKKLREAKAALKEQPKTWYQLEAERELQKSIEEAKANKAGGVAHQPGGDRDHDAAGGVLGGPDAKRPKVGNPSLMGHLAHSARATGWGQAQGAGAVNGGAVNGGTKMPSPVMPRPPAPASGTSQHSTPAHTSAPPPPPPENGFLGKEGRAHLEHHKNHDDSLYDNFSLKEAKEALKFIKEQNLVERFYAWKKGHSNTNR